MELHKLINIWLSTQDYNNVFICERKPCAFIDITIGRRHLHNVAAINDSYVILSNGERIDAANPELFDKIKQYIDDVIAFYK